MSSSQQQQRVRTKNSSTLSANLQKSSRNQLITKSNAKPQGKLNNDIVNTQLQTVSDIMQDDSPYLRDQSSSAIHSFSQGFSTAQTMRDLSENNRLPKFQKQVPQKQQQQPIATTSSYEGQFDDMQYSNPFNKRDRGPPSQQTRGGKLDSSPQINQATRLLQNSNTTPKDKQDGQQLKHSQSREMNNNNNNILYQENAKRTYSDIMIGKMKQRVQQQPSTEKEQNNIYQTQAKQVGQSNSSANDNRLTNYNQPLKSSAAAKRGQLTPEQVAKMTVDEIIAMSQFTKSTNAPNAALSPDNNSEEVLSSQDTLSPPLSNRLSYGGSGSQYQTPSDAPGGVNQQRQHPPAGNKQASYEKMIESRVFQFLNGYFNSNSVSLPPNHSQGGGNLSSQMPYSNSQRFNSHIGSNINNAFAEQNINNGYLPLQNTEHWNQNQQQQQQQQLPSSEMRYHQLYQQQRSASPNNNRGDNGNYQQQSSSNNEDLDEIKTATYQLMKEMRYMRKDMENMQISLNEKDAEIITLGMHLGDEKKKYQGLQRKETYKTLANDISSTSLAASAAKQQQRQSCGGGLSENGSSSQQLVYNNGGNLVAAQDHQREVNSRIQSSGVSKEDYQNQEILLVQLKEENSQFQQDNQNLKKQLQDIQSKHANEIKNLEQGKGKERQKQEQHILKLEAFVQQLQKENKQQQDDVEKALKIHKANEQLIHKNEQFKSEISNLKNEIENQTQAKERDTQRLSEQLAQAQQVLKKAKTGIVQDVCNNCIQTMQEKEDLIVQVEDLKRQFSKLNNSLMSRDESTTLQQQQYQQQLLQQLQQQQQQIAAQQIQQQQQQQQQQQMQAAQQQSYNSRKVSDQSNSLQNNVSISNSKVNSENAALVEGLQETLQQQNKMTSTIQREYKDKIQKYQRELSEKDEKISELEQTIQEYTLQEQDDEIEIKRLMQELDKCKKTMIDSKALNSLQLVVEKNAMDLMSERAAKEQMIKEKNQCEAEKSQMIDELSFLQNKFAKEIAKLKKQNKYVAD